MKPRIGPLIPAALLTTLAPAAAHLPDIAQFDKFKRFSEIMLYHQQHNDPENPNTNPLHEIRTVVTSTSRAIGITVSYL